MKKLNDEQRKLVEDNEGLIWYIGSKYIGRGYNPNEEYGGVLCIEDMLGTEYLEDSLVLFDLEDILNERELMVCKLRYQGMNQTEIAKMIGTTQAGVSRLLSKAKKKVEEAI